MCWLVKASAIDCATVFRLLLLRTETYPRIGFECSPKMSSNRSTCKHQTDKVRKGESDPKLPSSLHHPHHTPADCHHSAPQRIRHEQHPTSSNDIDPDRPRPKSSRTLQGDSAGQSLPRVAQNEHTNSTAKDDQHQRATLIVEKGGEAKKSGRPRYASLDSDGEGVGTRSAPLKRKKEKKTKTGRRTSRVDPNRQPYVLESDLRAGNNYYLYCLGKIYDVSDMRRRMEMQYWNILARQRQLGFHSQKECEVYMRYLSRPRTPIYSTTYSIHQKTKSKEGRRRREESDGRVRTASTADGKRKTEAADDDRDQRELSGDTKGKAVTSKPRAESSKPRAASSKPRAASSKSRAVDSEMMPASSKPRAASSKPRSVESETRPSSSKPRAASSKPRLDTSKEADYQSRFSRDREEEEDEEIDRQRSNEKTENEIAQGRNSPSGKDQRDVGTERKSSVAVPSNAAEAGKENDWEDTSSSDDESDRRGNTDGESKAADATNRDGRNTDAASSKDGDSDSD